MNKRKISILLITVILTVMLCSAVFAAQSKYKGFPVVNLLLNGQLVKPTSPPIVIDGTTYVPLRFISESMGINVSWDGKTQTVIIGSGATTSNQKSGNEFIVKDATGRALYSFKINKVTEMTERNPYSDKSPAQVIMIDYTYTNIASNEDVYLSDIHFKVIDSAGKVGYTYPNSPTKFPQSIPKGATCNAQMIFGLDTKSDTVTIYFYKDIFGSATATFKLPVE